MFQINTSNLVQIVRELLQENIIRGKCVLRFYLEFIFLGLGLLDHWMMVSRFPVRRESLNRS